MELNPLHIKGCLIWIRHIWMKIEKQKDSYKKKENIFRLFFMNW